MHSHEVKGVLRASTHGPGSLSRISRSWHGWHRPNGAPLLRFASSHSATPSIIFTAEDVQYKYQILLIIVKKCINVKPASSIDPANIC